MRYRVIGPDGIADRPEPYKNIGQATKAVKKFVERYRLQGYYKTAGGTYIPSCIKPEPWMGRTQKLEGIEEPTPEFRDTNNHQTKDTS